MSTENTSRTKFAEKNYSTTWKIENYNGEDKTYQSNENDFDGYKVSFSLKIESNSKPVFYINLPNLPKDATITYKASIISQSYGGLSANKQHTIIDEDSRLIELQIGIDQKEFLNSNTYLFENNYLKCEFVCNFRWYDEVYSNISYNSKKETGYVGLSNQGATCYMNSMLESLFHLPDFRRIVYNMPTTGSEDAEKSIPLNLQRLFCAMQFSENECQTDDLTKSFGWGESETIMQHDIQEFCRVLLDNLETKLKGTELSHKIAELFKGKYRNYIRCKNVDYDSSNIQEFYDLQMIVKDCPNLIESFKHYVEQETLEGDNQYSTEKFGKQDAIMGVEFLEFPPILQLHLRRFEYDFNIDRLSKINDKFEFPTEIDLTPYLAKDVISTKSNIYELFSVLVHSGGVQAGHYYAYIRTTTNVQWFKFDDDHVTKVNSTDAIDDNFGGLNTDSRYQYYYSYGKKPMKSYSAYMLVYVRKEDAPNIFEPILDDQVPQHLKDYLKVAEEIKRKREEQKKTDSNNISLNIVTEDDLIDSAKIARFGFKPKKSSIKIKIEKNLTLSDLYNNIAQLLDIPVNEIRLWKSGYYSNPTNLIENNSETKCKKLLSYSYFNDLDIFVQKKKIEEDLSILEKEIIIYMKFYFPNLTNQIQYIGSLKLFKKFTIRSIFEKINEILGYPLDTPLLAYLETISKTLKPIDINDTFSSASIDTGSLLVFQVDPNFELKNNSTFNFEKYLFNKQIEKEEKKKKEKNINNSIKTIEENNIKIYDSLEFLLDQSNKYVDTFLDHKYNSIILNIGKFENPTEILFKLKLPSTTKFIKIK